MNISSKLFTSSFFSSPRLKSSFLSLGLVIWIFSSIEVVTWQSLRRAWAMLSGTCCNTWGCPVHSRELGLMIFVVPFQVRTFYVSVTQYKSVEPKVHLRICFPEFLTEVVHTLLIPTPSVRQIWFLWVRIYFPVFCFLTCLLSGHNPDISKGYEHQSSFSSNIFLCIGGLPLWGINHYLMLLALTSNPAKIHHCSLPFLLCSPANCHTDLFSQMWFPAL